MDRMTEVPAGTEMSIRDFYDALAVDYDLMTNFERRFVQERPFFRLLVERFRIRTALDAGSGTGFLSILLAQLGASVTGVDISEEMLRRARANAIRAGVEIQTLQSSFQDLPLKAGSTYDAVFCLGNSLAHILLPEDLRLVLSNFATILNPGGVLFLQSLNYRRILQQQQRVQSAREVDGVTFVRFYDFEGDLIRFNLLRLEGKGNAVGQHIQSVLLRPILREEIEPALADAGFVETRFFGGISMEEFRPEESTDLVILATKPGEKHD